MNTNTIKRILNKGKLTGQEIGKLFVLNSIAEITAVKSKGKPNSIITNDELDNAINGIRTDRYQIEIYNSYIGLQNLAAHLYGLFTAYTQQIENGFNKILLGAALDLWKVEKEEYKANLPLIMTEEKYKEGLKEINADYINGEANYYDLFFMALNYYMENIETKKNLLSKVYAGYKDQLVKDKTLIKLYKERFLHTDFCCTDGDGYYTLSDGRDCQEVTLEEYIQDFFNRPLLKKLKASEKEELKDRYFNEMNGVTGACGIASVEVDAENKDLIKTINEINEIQKLRNPESKAEPIRVYEFIEIVRSYLSLQEGTGDFIRQLNQLEADSFILTYKVTKQDIMLDGYNFMPLSIENNAEDLLERYLKEVPELEKILNKDIAEKIGVKSINYFETNKTSKTKRVNYLKPLVKYEKLYKSNIYGYKDNAYQHFQICNGIQAAKNGVAIAQERSLTSDYKHKHFKEGLYNYTPKYDKYIELLRLLSTEKHSSNKEIVEEYIAEGFKNAYAIIALLEDIETIHKLEGLKDAYTFSLEPLEAKIKLFNSLKYYIKARDSIANNKDILLKLEADINYIDYTAYKPSKEARDKAREYITDIRVFDNAGHKINKFLSLYFNSDAGDHTKETL